MSSKKVATTSTAAATTNKTIIKVSKSNSDDINNDETEDNPIISESVLTKSCDIITKSDINNYEMLEMISEYGGACVEVSNPQNSDDLVLCGNIELCNDDSNENSKESQIVVRDINLKLNLDLSNGIEDDHGGDKIVLKNRIKFLESDDTIINQIFSQTITSSTGVTPTDEYENFAFDNLNSENGFDYSCNINSCSKNDKTGNLSNLCNSNNNSNQQSTTTSITENIDQYNEDDNSSILVLNIVDDTTIQQDATTKNDGHKVIGIKSRPSIIVDCYDDNDFNNEPCYVEPITPKQIKTYFDDDTISHVSSEKDEQNDSCASNNYNYNEIIDNEMELTDIEIYKSVSKDSHSLHKNGSLIDINEQVYIKNDTDTDDDSNGTTTDDLEKVELNDDEPQPGDVDNNEYTNNQIKTNIYDKLHLLYDAEFGSNLLSTQQQQQQHHMESSSVEQKTVTVTKKIKTTTATTEVSTSDYEIKSSRESGGDHKMVAVTEAAGQIGNKREIKSKSATTSNTEVLIQSNKQSPIANVETNNHHYDESTGTDNIDDEVQVKKSKKKKKSKVADDGNGGESGVMVKEKRKKSKKSKKSSDPEKENISVKENNIIESPLEKSNHSEHFIIRHKYVNIQHLCRSFGDLTSLCEAEGSKERAKSVADLRKFEPIHTGVSVKALRDSYCNLVGMIESRLNSNNICNSGLSNKCIVKTNRVTFSTKQFDMKSSFSKFDALQKQNILHVRSTDPAKAQEKFNGITELEKDCRACGKVVFQMEQVKAEKSIWHKNCFRCNECSKQLSVDTYQSHDGVLFCKPHFKALFTPKAVEDNEPAAASNDEAEELDFDAQPRKPELIIRENQPIELPPDVIRASDKPDLGLDDLQSLNVKERFQIFENSNVSNNENDKIADDRNISVKRSTSILSKLAKFQSKGMHVGNELLTEDQIGDEEDEDDDQSNDEDRDNEDADLIRAKKIQREKPMSFTSMNEVKTKFEQGHTMTKEERREERKQEIQSIRSRLFMGKQAKIKEMYQQAVADSEVGIVSTNRKPDIEIGDKAKSIKERFEKGEPFVRKNEDESSDQRPTSQINDDEHAVFEQGISKKSRSIFLEMDATAAKSGPITPSPLTPTLRTPDLKYRNAQQIFNVSTDDVVKCDDKVDDVKIETAEISSKFKFFETYQPDESKKKEFRITPPRDGVVIGKSPEREIYRDPDVMRADENQIDDPLVAEQSQTAKKMLTIFRQLEEKEAQKPQYEGLKPLKRFTPPPDEGRRIYNNESESDENYSESESDEDDDDEEESDEEDDVEQKPSNKFEDEFLKQATSAERAKQLRAKFEKWETNELKREKNNSSINLYDQNNEESQVESARSIRAKFESMRDSSDIKEKRDRIKVNRFVDTDINTKCSSSLEKQND